MAIALRSFSNEMSLRCGDYVAASFRSIRYHILEYSNQTSLLSKPIEFDGIKI